MILITNKSMTRVCKYIFVLVLLFTFVNNAFASVVTVTPPTLSTPFLIRVQVDSQ